MKDILLVISMIVLFGFGFVVADKGWIFFRKLFPKDEQEIEKKMDF